MRLFVIGSDYKWSIEKYYLDQWKLYDGVTVTLFPLQNMFYDYYYGNLLHKIKYRLGISNILSIINARLLEDIDRFAPDVIFVFKGFELLPSTLDKLSRKNIYLVNYNPDDPFVFSSAGSGNLNISQSIPYYDLHFSYNQETARRITMQYQIPAKELPFGFNHEFIPEEEFSAPDHNVVAFIGNPDKARVAFIKSLLGNDIKVTVFGEQWVRHLQHENILINGPVYGTELYPQIRKYRIQLNMMRPHNIMSHNMRTFEIPGAGGIQLAPYTKDHARFFVDGTNIFLYKSEKEAIEKIKHLQNVSKVQTTVVKQGAHQYAVEHGYAYKDRAAYAYHEIISHRNT